MIFTVGTKGQPPDNRSGARTMDMIGQIEPFARSSNNHEPNAWALKIISVGSVVTTGAHLFRRPDARMWEWGHASDILAKVCCKCVGSMHNEVRRFGGECAEI